MYFWVSENYAHRKYVRDETVWCSLTWISRIYVSSQHVRSSACIIRGSVFCWMRILALINRYLCWHVMFLRVFCCRVWRSSTYSGHRSQTIWCSSSKETSCWVVWLFWKSFCRLPTFSPRQQPAGFFNTRWFICSLQFVPFSIPFTSSISLFLCPRICWSVLSLSSFPQR